jgi:hypothetical protein
LISGKRRHFQFQVSDKGGEFENVVETPTPTLEVEVTNNHQFQ